MPERKKKDSKIKREAAETEAASGAGQAEQVVLRADEDLHARAAAS